ncbi:MAG: 4-hydroxy-tetrahydrodipicolinate reductase [candidate division KSB1 bacterium]|nr:4-hydroxy-tetrahydrodipicolinate reductase [candidate division KSB1 bacterium]
MNIAILGYGRMGKEVERQAALRGHRITAVFDVNDHFSRDSDCRGAEVLISFVTADAVIDNARAAALLGLPLVEGTTGWYDRMEEVRAIPDLTMLYSPNFSIGVYLFTLIVGRTAQLLANTCAYDCFIHEIHHRGKADSPSGTAKKLAEVVLKNFPDKKKVLAETSRGVIDPEALHVTSSRAGRVPGTHMVCFDSDADEILLQHTAHGREGFALGAVRAAEWLVGRKGIFTMDDFMNDIAPLGK